MKEGQLGCIVCGRTSDEVPVIPFRFKGKDYCVCPQHLPVMIHKPGQLADILPGIEAMGGSEGHDH